MTLEEIENPTEIFEGDQLAHTHIGGRKKIVTDPHVTDEDGDPAIEYREKMAGGYRGTVKYSDLDGYKVLRTWEKIRETGTGPDAICGA